MRSASPFWCIRQDVSADTMKSGFIPLMALTLFNPISDDICVMYLGQVVELCSSRELFRNPLHPYTRALLSAIPSIDIHNKMKPEIIQGEIVSPINPKPGCRFAARCKYATEACHQPQKMEEVESGHYVTCCRVHEVNG